MMIAVRRFETSGDGNPEDMSNQHQRCGHLKFRVSCFISKSIPGQNGV
jgi:hypothetical protein